MVLSDEAVRVLAASVLLWASVVGKEEIRRLDSHLASAFDGFGRRGWRA